MLVISNQFQNYSLDYSLNCTPLGPITITNQSNGWLKVISKMRVGPEELIIIIIIMIITATIMIIIINKY